MRITSILLYRVDSIPFRFRGKYGKTKKPTLKDLIQFKRDLEREEQNMLILRHPYLTSEQSCGHMTPLNKDKNMNFMNMQREAKNIKFNKDITIAERLKHLQVTEAWE